jgi:hypothetical protein
VPGCLLNRRGNEFRSACETTPGHPERDEESFHARLEDQGVVSFHIVALYQPNDSSPGWLGHRDLRPIDGDALLRRCAATQTA